jgi:hypothetical protein
MSRVGEGEEDTYIDLAVLCEKAFLIGVVEFGEFVPGYIVVDRVASVVTPGVEIPAFFEVVHAARQRESERCFACARRTNENQAFGTFRAREMMSNPLVDSIAYTKRSV